MEDIFPKDSVVISEEEFVETLNRWSESAQGKSIWLSIENGCADLFCKASSIQAEEQQIDVSTQELGASGLKGPYISIPLPQRKNLASFQKVTEKNGDQHLRMSYQIHSSVAAELQQEMLVVFSLSSEQPTSSRIGGMVH
jgi:hypothetical protein